MITVHFDGSCNPNPHGPIGWGSVVRLNGKVIAQLSDARPASDKNSNNVAEYLALSDAMGFLIKNSLNLEKIIFYGDSSLVINQISGKWKKMPKGGMYAEIARNTISKKSLFPNSEYVWIPREENTEADSLSTMLVELPLEEKESYYKNGTLSKW